MDVNEFTGQGHRDIPGDVRECKGSGSGIGSGEGWNDGGGWGKGTSDDWLDGCGTVNRHYGRGAGSGTGNCIDSGWSEL